MKKNIIIISLFLCACYGGKIKDKCVYKELDKNLILGIDSLYENSHFGDILMIIPKDSTCKDTNVYNVLIVRIYGKDKRSIICRLLDNRNNWQAIKSSNLSEQTKIIEYSILNRTFNGSKIYTADSTILSKQLMYTIKVDAKLIEI